MLFRIIRYLYLSLLLVTPLIYTSATSELFEVPKMFFVYTLTVLITSLHLVSHFTYKTPLTRKSPYNFALFLFLVTQAAATLLSYDLHTSIYGYPSRLHGGFLSTFSYVLLFTILPVYLDPVFIKRLINSSLIAGFLVAAYGIAQHFGIDKHVWDQDVQNRIFSTFGQPNWLAAYLCILLPLSLHQLFNSLNQHKYLTFLPHSINTLVLFTALLFTKSKSGLIAAILSLGLYFLFLGLKSWSLRKSLSFGSKAAVITIPVLFAVFTLTISNPIKDRIIPPNASPTPTPAASQPLNITPSQDIRKIVWQGALALWQKHPLFGTGTETFAYTYYWVRPVEHNLTSEWDFLYNKAHNEYLNFLATTGSVGFAAYIFLVLISLFLLVKGLGSSKSHLSLTLTSAYLSVLITNFAGFSVVIIAIFFFLLPLLSSDYPALSVPPKTKPNWLAIILISFITLKAFQRILGFVVADLTFAQSEKLQSSSLTQAYDNISLSTDAFPTEPVYQMQLAKITRDLALANKDNPGLSQRYIDESVAAGNRAVEISPINTNLLKERAHTFYLLSTLDPAYFQTAVDSLIKVASLAPTDAKTFYTLGQFLEAVDKPQDAAVLYQKAVSLKPNYDHAYFALAKIQYHQKLYDEAKTNLKNTLKIAPANTDAQKMLDEISQMK